MKKIILMCLVVIMAALTAACSAQTNSSAGATDSPIPSASASASASASVSASPSASSSPSASPTSSPSMTPGSSRIKWGDSKDTVKSAETLTFEEEGEKTLVYSVEISGINMYMQYSFNDQDELYEFCYISVDEHNDMQGYIDDYDILKESLTYAFGKPTNDSIFKTDSRADKVDALTALESGYTAYQAIWNSTDVWKSNDTEINLIMTKSDDAIAIGIFFRSISITGPNT